MPPYSFFPCCAKTVPSRLMKPSDFYYNYIGHHLKWFSVTNNLGCCQAINFVKERFGQNFQFFVQNGLFLLQNVFSISDFSARIRNQRLGIDLCAKFQLHWTKDKGTRILTRKDTKNGLMTSYLPSSDDISKIFMAFERFCPRVPSCQVWL